MPKLLDGRQADALRCEDASEAGTMLPQAGSSVVHALAGRLRACRVEQSLRRRMVGAWLMRIVKGAVDAECGG